MLLCGVLIVLLLLAIAAIYLATGFSVNGQPMRFDPAAQGSSKMKSWHIEGTAAQGVPISCSFVEFDERGDFLDFNQHLNCQAKLKQLADKSRLIVVIYCHGWKNSSQSDDVLAFNCFLSKFAASHEIEADGLRVHGIYLGWRGNRFRPYVDKAGTDSNYQQTNRAFGGPIVDEAYHRANSLLGFRVFRTNLSPAIADPDVFLTSKTKYPSAAWRLTNQPLGEPVTLNGLPLSMRKSNYWIVSCGKELIGSHTDVWSQTAMEMYAGLYRAVQSRGGVAG